jgi:hypothetical protein
MLDSETSIEKVTKEIETLQTELPEFSDKRCFKLFMVLNSVVKSRPIPNS